MHESLRDCAKVGKLESRVPGKEGWAADNARRGPGSFQGESGLDPKDNLTRWGNYMIRERFMTPSNLEIREVEKDPGREQQHGQEV